jgi:hypothetical protein
LRECLGDHEEREQRESGEIIGRAFERVFGRECLGYHGEIMNRESRESGEIMGRAFERVFGRECLRDHE